MEASSNLQQTARLQKLIDSQQGTFIERLLAVDTISCNTMLTELTVDVMRIEYKWFFMLMIVVYEYYCREFEGLEEKLEKEVIKGLLKAQLSIFGGQEIKKEEVIEYIGLRTKLRDVVKCLEKERVAEKLQT
jgi:hypothetical protein